jgi:RHS repeat-associated protein
VNKDRYNEVITYDDHRGNIRNIQRTGFLGNGNYGMIDNIMMTYTGNKLNTITEWGDMTKGFKGSNGTVRYDDRGNMTSDPSRGIDVSYNYLDLPTLIQTSVGRIEFLYDASGNLLTKTVTYNSGRGTNIVTDYVKGIEYANNVMSSIYHDEGRLVQVNGTWQSEYVIKDHLGNARVTFRDVDGNGFITASDISQEAHYYPFGMQMEGSWSPPAAVRIPYLYNGIEHVSDLGLDINTALFRTLDPALGRWWQIDPKAEAYGSRTPYESMGNNPILQADPRGDFWHIAIGAVVGGAINVATHWSKINSFGDGLLAFGIGAAGGAITGLTGGAVSAAVGLGTTGALSGMVIGGAGNAIGSIVTGVGNQLAYGENFTFENWAKDVVKGAVIGGVLGGAVAFFKGQNFWWGNTPLKIDFDVRWTEKAIVEALTKEQAKVLEEIGGGSHFSEVPGVVASKTNVEIIKSYQSLTVYRSISSLEYRDLLKDGVFRNGPNSYDTGKLFTANMTDAQKFSDAFGNNIIVKARIPAGVTFEKLYGVDGLKYIYSVPLENLSRVKYLEMFWNGSK